MIDHFKESFLGSTLVNEAHLARWLGIVRVFVSGIDSIINGAKYCAGRDLVSRILRRTSLRDFNFDYKVIKKEHTAKE